jgi:aminoacyl-tRNA hydrolase
MILHSGVPNVKDQRISARPRALMRGLSRANGLLLESWRLRAWYKSAVAIRLAIIYRRCLPRVRFVGVTGSCGKTTTKDLLAGLLASVGRVHKTAGNGNNPEYMAPMILKVRPNDAYCVVEIGVGKHAEKQVFQRALELVRPHVAVVTNIGSDHISAFGSLQAIAAQKSELVAALRRDGVAVLNADDPLVLGMQDRCAGRVMTYGLSTAAMVRAEDVRASWPERLAFTLVYNGERFPVQTQLCGRHWVSCVLAALAASIALRVPLATAVRAIEALPPSPGRMSVATRSDGVVFVSDDVKSPFWTMPCAFQFVREANVQRKIVVIGTISDYTGNSDRAYVAVANQALAVADRVVFVGARAAKCLKARRDAEDHALQAFPSLDAARVYLDELLRPGDLVLLKGTWRDHLDELLAQRVETRAQADVARDVAPDPAGIDSVGPPAPSSTALRVPEHRAPRSVFAVVGLGNPGEHYAGTPHNVGQHTLDHVAAALNGTWRQDADALVACVVVRGWSVHLLKPLAPMNSTGPVLLQTARRLCLSPAQCLIVHDDLDLPLGTVRYRVKGSDGGHRGVRSILQAFGTNALPRVKIGIGRPEQADRAAQHVVSKFGAEEAAVISRACALAAQRVLDIVRELPSAEAAPASEYPAERACGHDTEGLPRGAPSRR